MRNVESDDRPSARLVTSSRSGTIRVSEGRYEGRDVTTIPTVPK